MKAFFRKIRSFANLIISPNFIFWIFWFLQKHPEFMLNKKHTDELTSFDTHHRANCHLHKIWKIWSFFPKKKPIFFKKKTISHVLRKSYYLSRILRQLCYILVIKSFHSQNIGHFYSHQTLSIVKNVEKRRISAFWVDDFLSILQ